MSDTAERRAILAQLAEEDRALSPAAVAAALPPMAPERAAALLDAMARGSRVARENTALKGRPVYIYRVTDHGRADAGRMGQTTLEGITPARVPPSQPALF